MGSVQAMARPLTIRKLGLPPTTPPAKVSSTSIYTEVWLRNPGDPLQSKAAGRYGDAYDYMPQVRRLNVERMVFGRDYLTDRKMSVDQLISNYFEGIPDKWGRTPPVDPYDIIIVGEGEAVRRRPDVKDVTIPVWRDGERLLFLHTLCEEASDGDRIILAGLPTAFDVAGRRVIRRLAEFQEEYPDLIFQVTGVDSFHATFGFRFQAMDFHPGAHTTGNAVVFMPTGEKRTVDNLTRRHDCWFNLFGMKRAAMTRSEERILFNIRSVLWAGQFYSSTRPVFSQALPAGVTPQPGDKVQCDTCSLAEVCQAYQPGSVCTVSKEVGRIAEHFRTRNVEEIFAALGGVMDVQLDRLDEGRRLEQQAGKLSPEVTRIINSLMKNGMELATLASPELRPKGPSITITNTNTAGAIGTPGGEELNEQQIAAAIYKQLQEELGYPLEAITADLIRAVAMGQEVPPYRRALNVNSREA